MIRGLHAMFYSSKAPELRAFFKDKLGFDGTDVGDVPGDFVVQLYQPKYEK